MLTTPLPTLSLSLSLPVAAAGPPSLSLSLSFSRARALSLSLSLSRMDSDSSIDLRKTTNLLKQQKRRVDAIKTQLGDIKIRGPTVRSSNNPKQPLAPPLPPGWVYKTSSSGTCIRTMAGSRS